MTREERIALARLLREAADGVQSLQASHDEWAPDSDDPDLDDEVEQSPLDKLVQKLNDTAEAMEGGSDV